MIYGQKFLDPKYMDLQPELTIYVSENMVLPLFEDPVMRTITISDGKKINVKLNITNQEGCSRGSSTTGTTKAKHGPRVKYIDKNNKQGIPIQVRIKTGDIFFGADSSVLVKSEHQKKKLHINQKKQNLQ